MRVLWPDTLDLWTIFFGPSDYPGKYVLKKFTIVGGQLEPTPAPEPTAITLTLEQARKHLPDGLVNMGRDPKDEPIVVETWI